MLSLEASAGNVLVHSVARKCLSFVTFPSPLSLPTWDRAPVPTVLAVGLLDQELYKLFYSILYNTHLKCLKKAKITKYLCLHL
jgi:hypothetical protein